MHREGTLAIDESTEVERITAALHSATRELRRKGLVVAVSGGVDSSTCLALAVRALGPDRVLGLLLPERESSPESVELGRAVCQQQGVAFEIEDISAILSAAGCYRRRDEAIRQVFPEYDESYRQKMVVPPLADGDRLTYFSLVIESPAGERKKARLPLGAYLQIVAATNFKQRTRKMLEYYHADRLSFAVVGTPNRLEYDQGFFVKGGDGLADIKPIAHLYKTQVYALAAYLGLAREVVESTPTTDTYSLPQGQDEFYFALPYRQMDLMLAAFERRLSPEQAAEAAGLTAEQARWVYRDIQSKRRAARYLHLPPILVEPSGDDGTGEREPCP